MNNKQAIYLTDEELDNEIKRLKESPDVQLAKQKNELEFRARNSARNKKRNLMNSLLALEQRGAELRLAGITPEKLNEMYAEST
jgi:hypothetical protein